jgi:hypothetical protein
VDCIAEFYKHIHIFPVDVGFTMQLIDPSKANVDVFQIKVDADNLKSEDKYVNPKNIECLEHIHNNESIIKYYAH